MDLFKKKEIEKIDEKQNNQISKIELDIKRLQQQMHDFDIKFNKIVIRLDNLCKLLNHKDKDKEIIQPKIVSTFN